MVNDVGDTKIRRTDPSRSPVRTPFVVVADGSIDRRDAITEMSVFAIHSKP